MGSRRLQALIAGLPSSSSLAKSMYPDTAGADWGTTQELLATAAELIDLGNRQFVIANSKKGSRAPDAISIKRPWQIKARRKATLEETKELMSGGVVVPSQGG